MKRINFKKFLNRRNAVFSLLILTVVFLFGQPALADFGTWAGNVIGGIIAVLIRAVAAILILLVEVLVKWVAPYSDFIHADAITKGWIVVRDVCNMFFVVVLLVIAFATVLGQEDYGAKKNLPKLIMAAVLINFSKLFCGLMIDVANVVMLTFVNAFSAVGAGNILNVLGISKITQISTTSDVSFSTIVSSYIFGLIYVLIATVVIAAMLGMLVMRIVMIWILVVLSPLAFFLQAVPGGGRYASQWWTRWTSNLIVGPVIAFFLWLSLAALQGGNNPVQSSEANDTSYQQLSSNNGDINYNASSTSGLGSEAGTPVEMAKFVIAIGMLLGGMKIAQEVGGETGSILGKGMAQINKGKAVALGAVTGLAAGTAKFAGRKTLLGVGKGINVFSKTDQATGKKKGNLVGNFAMGWQSDLEATAKKNRKAAAAKYLGKLGIGEKGSEAGQDLINSKGFQSAANIVKGAAIGTALGGPAGLAVALASGAAGSGFTGLISKLRGNAQDRIKNADKTKTDYSNAQSKYTKAKADRDAYDSSQATVTEFEANQTKFNDLEARGGGKTGFANTLSAQERQEYAEKSKYLKDNKNIGKYNKGKDFLNNNNVQNLDQAVSDAQQDMNAKKTLADKSEGQLKKDKNFIKITDNLGFNNAQNIKSAMADMTKKKKQAQDWVKIASNDDKVLESMGKASNIYSSAGASETWKRRLDELNGGAGDSVKAVDNMVNEVGSGSVDESSMEAFAKLLAAYKKGGSTVNPATLGRLESALIGQGKNPADFEGKVSTQYRSLGSDMMLKEGSGKLEYETFAKNSVKDAATRDEGKNIMGVSFAKVNDKAKALGVDYSLDPKAGVNHKADGAKLNQLSQVMSSLIDDEIKGLEAAGADVNAEKIKQLNRAKNGLAGGFSLKNTDVSYGGDASQQRAGGYNTVQHENMHQAGAKDEGLVHDSANALQEAKLIGKIPGTDGQRYDLEIGKIIASMENNQATPDAIREAVDTQISKWQPASNAERVIETENGKRETVSDHVPDVLGKGAENFEQAVDKLLDSLNKPLKPTPGQAGGMRDMSISDKNFFRMMFSGLKKVISKDDDMIGEKLSPLAAMAANEEKGNKE